MVRTQSEIDHILLDQSLTSFTDTCYRFLKSAFQPLRTAVDFSKNLSPGLGPVVVPLSGANPLVLSPKRLRHMEGVL